jgi:CheY-like chemotaxis protein
LSTTIALRSGFEGLTSSETVRRRYTATSCRRVLIIDDDAAELSFVRNCFQRFELDHPCEILGVSMISELFDALRRGEPDLILFAPLLKSFDVLRYVRAIRAYNAAIPVIALTSRYDRPGSSLEGLGVSACQPKPVAPAELEHLVALLWQRRSCIADTRARHSPDRVTSLADQSPGETPRPWLTPGQPLGELLVRAGIIALHQLEEALQTQEQLAEYLPLGHILFTHGVVSRRRLAAILDGYKKRAPVGEILLRSGAITREQLAVGLRQHVPPRVTLGAALVQRDFVTEETVRRALCAQLNVRFVDPNAIVVDPSVRHFINRKYAAKHRLVPVAQVNDRLVVVVDDPRTITLADELAGSTGLSIDVVTSTPVAIGRIFAGLYGEALTVGAEAAERAVVAAFRARKDAWVTLEDLRRNVATRL